MEEIAKALNITTKSLYAFIALLFIAIVYQYSPQAGLILGLIAIVTLLTR